MRKLKLPTAVLLLSSAPWATASADLGEIKAAVETLLRAGSVPAAIERLTALEGDLARDPAVLALLGRARVLNREFAAAEPVLEQAVAAGATDFGTLLTLGAVLWENGKLDRAEDRYREAVRNSADAPSALYALAKLLLWRGDAVHAVPLFRQVRERRPQWTEVCLAYARALEQTNDLETARRQIEIFLDGAPEHAEALYSLATIHRRLGRPGEAQEALDRFVEASSEDRRRALQHGRQAVALNGVRETLSRGETLAALEVLRAFPETIESLLLEARAWELAGDAASALRALEKAVAMDPSRTDVRVALQEAYRRQGAGE